VHTWAQILNKNATANYKPYISVSLLRRNHWNSPWKPTVKRYVVWKPVT